MDRRDIVATTESPLPLTEAQKELWLLAQLDPGASVAYNVCYALSLRGALDVRALGDALQAVVDRHDVLRAGLDDDLLVVSDDVRVPLDRQDVSGLPHEQQRDRLRQETARPFDLRSAPLLRATLFQMHGDEHLLLLVSHHVVVDAGSMATLFAELGELYSAARDGREPRLAPPPRPGDHLRQDQQVRAGEDWRAAEAYWLRRFERPAPVLDLPTDFVRPTTRAFRGRLASLPIEQTRIEALAEMGRAQGCSLFMILFAAFAVLMHRLTRQEEMVIGINVSGRSTKASRATVGYLTRLLPIRLAMRDDQPATALLAQVRDTLLEALEHRQYTLGDLIRGLNPPRSPGRSPLVDVVFNFDAAPGRFPFTGLDSHLVPVPVTGAKYDLDFNVIETAHGLRCDIEYDVDLFRPESVARLHHLYTELLSALAAQPDAVVRELPWITADDRQQLLVGWNDTARAVPSASIAAQLEAQARLRPAARAVVHEGVVLTYAELNARANRLARHLRLAGVRSETRVGVSLERGLEWAVAICAVWKAGGAYVPLDVAYPKARLAFMLDDADAELLLTDEAMRAELPPHRARTICLDTDWEAIDAQSDENLDVDLPPDALAYVMYTSGSTGRPKGAMLEHRGMMNHLWAKVHDLSLTEADSVAQNAPASFDISVWQLFAVLLAGGEVQIIGEEIARDALQVLGEADRLGVTVLETVPTVLSLMVAQQQEHGAHRLALASMRWMISNAEPLPVGLCEQWAALYPRVALMNAYGPTECSDDVTHLVVRTPLDGLTYAPLGGRVQNMRLYVLDESLQPVPVGVPGELYIGGVGVGRGYLGRPMLTAEKFVPDPFAGTAGARLYRTGDHVRLLADGACDFIGRRDHQIKLRGLRVELPEIEAALRQHPDVQDCAVIVREDQPDDRRLVGYIVARPRAAIDVAALRTHLKASLPDHMVPSAIVLLARMPLTVNEKIDRTALPPPDGGGRLSAARAFQPPRTRIEEAIAKVWAAVLCVERVGVEDNFFELGGHSLLATQVMSRLRTLLNVQMPLRVLFERPTVADLARAVEQARGVARPSDGAMARIPRDQPLPLSYAQQRLWFLQAFETDKALYNLLVVLRVRGQLDAAIFERALTEIVQRHEVLRTTFREDLGIPVQIVHATLPPDLLVVDLQGHAPDDRRREIDRLIDDEARRPFELARGPLLRNRLLRLADDEHVLILSMHHIVGDGWSVELFLRELGRIYDAFAQGEPSPLGEMPVQYADYAMWQRQWLQGDVLQAQTAYWRQQLDGMPHALELPSIGRRPAAPSHRGRLHWFTLSPELTASLQALSGAQGVTLFITLLAAFQALLSRYSGRTDIVVGSPIAGRSRGETEALIGFFVNVLVLRTDLAGRPTFVELLQRVRDTALDAYANQDLPFEKLVEELQPPRDMSRTPLFQILFDLQSASRTPPSSARLTFAEEAFEFPMEKFDLTLRLIEEAGGLKGFFLYRTDLFAEAMIAGLARHFELLLTHVAAAPHRPVAAIDLFTPSDRAQVLEAWNRLEPPDRRGTCLHQLVEAQAARTPHATAVIKDGRALTYADLDARADAIAARLRAVGIGAEARVGLCTARTLDMVAALLGILKAGGAYVPLDPEYPQERLQFMLRDAAVRAVITESRLRPLLAGHGAPELYLDGDPDGAAAGSGTGAGDGAGGGARASIAEAGVSGATSATLGDGAPASAPVRADDVQSDNTAYVIYTSGSTGRPKGVAIEHRSAVNLVRWACKTFADDGLDSSLASTSICFDLSVFEIFAPLACGGTVILADHGIELARLAARDRVRLLNTVPTAIKELLTIQGLPAAVRTVNLGGEAVKRPLVDEIYDAGVDRVYDVYGPTETTVYSTAALLARRSSAPDVVIGTPIDETQVYVLDGEGLPVPIGVAGELYIGGTGLARGYVNQPASTADRFVPDPFSGRAGARLYRTGDAARWYATGALEYLGRLDQQVKIHGFRVETGEIEAALVRQPGVQEAAVTAVDIGDETRLVAYVVAEDAPLETSALRAALKAVLPRYMVPAAIVLLDRMPLTANGKVDRRALPAPKEAGVRVRAGYLAPRTDMERRLCRIWAETLGVEQVGIEQDFFELGGHSLLAMRVISHVRSEIGTEIDLRLLFEWPTVAGFAERVDEEVARGALQGPPMSVVPRDGDLALSYAQSRVWFVQQLQPHGIAYNAPFHLRLTGPLDRARLARCLTAIVRRHEVLRTTYPTKDGQPVQQIHPPHAVQVPVVDLSALADPVRQAVARAIGQQEAERPFDLAHGPMLRVLLLRLRDDRHELLLGMHHIASDGWSRAILLRDLMRLWQADAAAQPPALPELSIQYADYAVWQQAWLRHELLQKQLPYWRRQLQDVPVLDLPTDRPRPPTTTHPGHELRFALSGGQSAEIADWSRRAGVTPFMTLLAAYQWLLSRWSGQEDIAVGTVIANRNRHEIEDLVGFFVNTLVLRTDVSGAPTFEQLVTRVREVTLGAYAHHEMPFEKLVEELNPVRDLRRAPLFQVRFTLDTAPPALPAAIGLEIDEIDLQLPEVKFELTMALEQAADGGLSGCLVYAADLFERSTMERLIAQFRRMLTRVLAAPAMPLPALSIIDDDERDHLLQALHGAAFERPAVACVHTLFEAQARLAPQARAIVYEDQHLTYAALDARADGLARVLRARGVGPEVRVGICMERGLDMVVALLAVLKAGGAYVPIDPSNPTERMAVLLDDAQIPVLLTHEHLRERLPSLWLQVLCLDDESVLAEIAAVAEEAAVEVEAGTGRAPLEPLESPEPPEPQVPEVQPDNLAYVIYTSGSTGQPKAVGIEHRHLVNYVLAICREMPCAPGWKFAYLSSMAADLGNTALFGSLCSGGELHVISDARARDGRKLAAYLRDAAIDCTKITPSHLAGLEPTPDLLPAKLLVLGGEPSAWAWIDGLRALRPDMRMMNHYGPTECTVGAVAGAVDRLQMRGAEHLPLGRPLGNVRAYVLDDAMQAVPMGMAGELYIGGDGVGRGYLNRPAATADRFLPDPFHRVPGARLYRTGDRARWLTDGTLEFLGRVDHQVKIRGFRVELGEIESVLAQHPQVRQAAVLLQPHATGPRLAAYVSRRHAETDGAGLSLHALPNGLTIAHNTPDETDFLYRQIFDAEYYLQDGIDIPADGCIVDVGANIGLFTLFAAQRCTRGRLLAFEPIDALFRITRHNARLCEADVSVFPFGLADSERTAEFTFYPGYSTQSGLQAYAVGDMDRRFDADIVTARLRRLSDVLREEHVEGIDLLKIDVQRSEMDVLRGIDDEHWSGIAQVAMFIIRHERREDTEARVRDVVDLLERRGFSVTAHQDGQRQGGDWSIYARNPETIASRAIARAAGGHRPNTAAAALGDELRSHLKARLPDYMVPPAVHVLPALPLTASGKLDRRALPAHLPSDSVQAFDPPRTEIETLVCGICADVLGVERVGLRDDFFALGGHSLLATQVVSRLERAAGVEIPLAIIFSAAVMSDLAAEVARAQRAAAPLPPALAPIKRDAFVDRVRG